MYVHFFLERTEAGVDSQLAKFSMEHASTQVVVEESAGIVSSYDCFPGINLSATMPLGINKLMAVLTVLEAASINKCLCGII